MPLLPRKFPTEPRLRAASRALATVLLVAAVAGGGCATTIRDRFAYSGPDHEAVSVYQGRERLPRELKRVAVLPLAISEDNGQADALRGSLESILERELAKSGRFELLNVDPDALRAWTGSGQWVASEALPPDFFARLREETACDAVLFCELTECRAYPPLALGWRLRLVDARTGHVWWATDEVFDASELEVANSARRYYLAQATQPRSLTDPEDILRSPSRFARYTTSVLVSTCPPR
jgi:hypothetical protein